MLSYRHAFHAGNHADVLKHYVFYQVLQYFNLKEKPYWVIDTHAGAGMYALTSEYSQKNAEYLSGISRLYDQSVLSTSLMDYVALIRLFNSNGELRNYPGSPSIALRLMRSNDKCRFFELHPTDFVLLDALCKPHKKQCTVQPLDGFLGLKSCLPPHTKRGVVLIDPPYEQKQDYLSVISALKDALKRFATGSYLIWYPLLQRPEPENMVQSLQNLALQNWLNVTLTIQKPSKDGFGMHGSGMFVINPPWNLVDKLEIDMPFLKSHLALDEHAEFTLTSQLS